MIWVEGRIVRDDELRISVLDRTFEHGLGLFETFRTWGGRPSLMSRHLERLSRSARELGLPLDPARLPGPEDVTRLLRAEGISDDAVLRITMSGGTDDQSPGTVWMRSRPLPPPIPGPGARARSTWTIGEHDPMARYKSLNYWSRRIAFETARRDGFDEELGRTPRGFIFEGSRSNVFVMIGDVLVTPEWDETGGASNPFLPGIMRAAAIERAEAIGLLVHQEPRMTIDVIERADEVFLTNSGRGIVPVAQFGPHRPGEESRTRLYEAPGPWTCRLRAELVAFLRSGDVP